VRNKFPFRATGKGGTPIRVEGAAALVLESGS
jgi:hypothetical protein